MCTRTKAQVTPEVYHGHAKPTAHLLGGMCMLFACCHLLGLKKCVPHDGRGSVVAASGDRLSVAAVVVVAAAAAAAGRLHLNVM